MYKYLTAFICTFLLFNPFFPAKVSASAMTIMRSSNTDSDHIQNAPVTSDDSNNTDTVAKNDDSISKKDIKIWQKVQNEEESNKKRYVLIAKDKRFYYYIDRKTARWIYEPYTKREIMDVWIQLVDVNKKDKPDKDYSNVPEQVTYLLDHYYIRPHTRQVQFLCELEVTGQPSNTVKQNVYSIKNWEEVIPGSVEETIYNAVMATKGQLVKISANNRSLDRQASEFLDRVFNISL